MLKNVVQKVSIPLSVLLPKSLSEGDREKALAFYGKESANDQVIFSATAGAWIFDILAVSKELPKAPYARTLEKSRLQELATVYSKSTGADIEVPDDLQSALSKALKEDELWDKVRLSVEFQVGDETRIDLLTGGVIEVFPAIQEELLKLCDQESP